MNLINLKETNNHYVLSIPQNLEKRAKKIVPFEWDSINKVWKYPKNNDTFDSLINEFNQDEVILNITPPVATHKSQEDSLSKKNLIIEKLQLKIDSLENEASEREREIDRYISNIVSLNEKVNQLIDNDNDIENAIKKVAKRCAGDNKRCLKIIEEIEFDSTLPIELPKKIINILKSINKCKDDRNDFADLIGQSRENKLLSKEAIGLLHVIRNQRNIFAHATINPNTRYMRVIFLMAAFALLSEEIKQEYWDNDNKLNPVLLIFYKFISLVFIKNIIFLYRY